MGRYLLDQYTILHMASGVIAYFLGLSFTQWFILHMLFELVENTHTGVHVINRYLTFWPGGNSRPQERSELRKPQPDAIINQVGDQIGSLLGWWLAASLDKMGQRYHWAYGPK